MNQRKTLALDKWPVVNEDPHQSAITKQSTCSKLMHNKKNARIGLLSKKHYRSGSFAHIERIFRSTLKVKRVSIDFDNEHAPLPNLKLSRDPSRCKDKPLGIHHSSASNGSFFQPLKGRLIKDSANFGIMFRPEASSQVIEKLASKKPTELPISHLKRINTKLRFKLN